MENVHQRAIQAIYDLERPTCPQHPTPVDRIGVAVILRALLRERQELLLGRHLCVPVVCTALPPCHCGATHAGQ